MVYLKALEIKGAIEVKIKATVAIIIITFQSFWYFLRKIILVPRAGFEPT